MSNENTENNKEFNINTIVKDKSIWLRLLYMVLFAFLYSVAEFVIIAVVVYQFLHVLITGGDKDEKIANLGTQLSAYIYQILQFQTFNTEDKPFPIADWPEAKPLQAEADKPKTTRKRATRKSTAKKAPAKKPAARKTTHKPVAKKETPEADSTQDSKPEDTSMKEDTTKPE